MIVRNWKDVAGIPHDETFVTPNTTMEVTDVDGNTRQVRYGDLSDEEKQAVSRRNSSTAILRAPDQTQEAADIRNMWGVAPRVSINNGKLKLSGTKSFLESDTAKILRNAFKEMDGKIYNTESLDKQIEGWNVALQQQAKDYIDAVEGMNWINYSTLQTSREGNPNLITFEDYLRIANNREVGKDANALNSDKLIFVGYEWDDNGNRIPKYVPAKDFAAEFNSTPNPVGHAKNLAEAWENRNADTLISGKRRAYSSLVAQANEGDAGAIAKLMYLQGGSTKGPANVVLSGEEKLKDFEFVAVNNIVNGLVSGLDYATAPYNVLFGNPLGIPRLIGRLGNAMSSGDFNKFWESDSVTKMREDYASVNDWTNNYFKQITPGSTDLAIGVGGTIGGISGMLYSIVSADIGRELSAHTVSTALDRAGAWLEASGNGTRYTAYVTSFSGVQQQLNVTRNGATVSSIPTVANGARNSIQVSVVIPNFIVRNHEGFAKALIDASFKAQAAAQGVAIAGDAGSNISYVITSKNDALTQLLTPDVWRDMQAGSTALSAGGRFTINVLQGASLEKLRNMENGLRASMSLALQGAHAALRSADEYLRKSYDGEDLGDMATYVANDVATSVVAGATLIGIGQWIKDAKDIANAANIPPTRILDTSKLLSDNQAGGFYQQEPEFVWSQDNGNVPLANRLQEGGMTPQEYNEIVKTFGSIITANGEKFFLPNDISEAMVVPGAVSPEGVDNAIGMVKDGAVQKSTIVPAVGGFNVVTTSRNLLTGETTTGVTFHLDFDSANRELQNNTIPVVNPKTLGNSDLAVSAPVMPLDLGDPAHGSISPLATLPDGTSRVKIDPGIAYYTLDEFSAKLSDIVSMMSPEAKDVYMATINAEDNELWKVNEASAATGVMYAPDLSKVPTTADEAAELARRVSYVLRYAAQDENNNAIIPTRIPATTAETRKARRMTTDRIFYAQPATEYQAPEEDVMAAKKDDRENNNEFTGWHSEMDYALGGFGETVDVYSEKDNSVSRDYVSLQSIIGHNPNTAAMLRRQVGKNTYDLASSLAALWLVDYISDNGGSNSLINDFGVTTKTAAKNFIASLYSGRPNNRAGWTDAPWFRPDSIEDLGYQVIDVSRLPSGLNPWKLTDDSSNERLWMLDKTPGAVGSKSKYEYYRDEKGLVTDVVMMSPYLYFDILKAEGNVTDRIMDDIFSDTDYYVKKYESGEKVDVPYLLYTSNSAGDYYGQEGRHRIAAAAKKGYQRVPVTIVHPASVSIDDILARYDSPELKTVHNITDWVSSVITAFSTYGDPVKRFSDAIDAKLDHAEEAIDAYNRVYSYSISRDEPLAGVKSLLDIVRKNKEELAKFISRPSMEKSEEIYNKVAKKAVKNVADGVKEAIKKDGLEAKTDFFLPGYIDEKTGIAHLYLDDEVYFGQKGELRWSEDTGAYKPDNIHIPKGTKVLRSDYIPYMSLDQALNATSGVDGYHFIVDTKPGFEKRDDGYYLNTPSGKSHHPVVIEFSPKNTAIYDYWHSSNYGSLTGKLFKPLHDKKYLHDIYKVILPGGDINWKTNPKLRTAKSLGTVPETNLISFVDNLISRLEKGAGSDYRGLSLVKAFDIVNDELDTLKEDFPDLYNAIYDKPSDSSIGTEIRDIYNYLSKTIDDAEQDGAVYNPGGFLAQDVLSAMESNLIKAALENNSKFPSGLSRDMAAVKKMEGDASHTSLAPWVAQRGMAAGGNQVVSNVDQSDFTTDLSELKPGDDYVDYGFAFASLNPAVPIHYANGRGDRYIIRYIGQKGTKVYYYGDQENFADQAHRADGGALVIPRGAHGVVASIHKMQDGTKIIYVVLDGEDGPYTGPIDKESSVSVEETKKRRTVEVTDNTPNKYVVTENGLTKASFSDPQAALDFKNEAPGSRQIYELDDNAPIMERPPVTSDSLYYPTVRSDSALGRMPAEEEPAPDNTIELMAKFDSLLTAMNELKDSPTDYTQGIIDIVRLVQQIYNAVAAKVDIATVYEDYARQIADNVEQPDADPKVKEILKPLLDVLDKLGHYFDPSGKSLTKKFYLPTSLPGTNLVSLEEYLASVEGSFDSEHPVITSFDDILIDPTRIGDSGFWEQRTGDLFRDEDGNFTMDRAATLEESLTAYTISALTRGKGALTVAANNEIAASKYDRNRNQITGKAAVKGLTMADENRARIRASQLKAARGFSKAVKEQKLDELKDKYTDEDAINAINEAYAAKNFVKSIDYVNRVNGAASVLGYRHTLTINPIKGSALRFGSQNGLFKGIANDIRIMSRVNVTGTKYVTRHNEKVCVGYGMSQSQQKEYEFTRTEPAVNLGDATDMAYNSDKFAVELLRDITESYNSWIQQGTDEAFNNLLSKVNDFARSNFRLIANPERAGADLVKQLIRNYATYRDPTALHITNLSTISDWVKRNALNELNSAIKMADLSLTDKRTINAINEVMTSLMVGTPVYISQVTNFLTRASYSAALSWSASPPVGNLLSETGRLSDVYNAKVITRALKRFFKPSERRKLKEEFADQVSRYGNDQELVGLLAQTKGIITKAIEGVEKASMTPLEWSEAQKNYLFYLCADENAKLLYPNDPSAQMQNKLRMFNDTAIAGGAGTTPNIAKSNIGRLAFIFKTFTLRNWDDFIEMAENIGYGRSGSYKWDESDGTGGSTGGQGGYSTPKGEKFNYKKAARFVGGTFLRRYLLWLFVLGPLGRSIWDALGGDPTGLSENFSRGLYDDENTDEYEGMTPLDNFINMLPTGFILGTLKDLYFAARRSGVQTNNFFGPIDVNADARLQKDLRQHLPFGVATNRLGDMLDLLDRGYSFTGAGNKAYAAPESFTDTLKGMLLGKNTTSNAMAYNKYRYGSVDVWGNILEGDWLDFAMTANPFADTFGMVKFDSTRESYNGVFHGDYSDVPTMQAAVADLRNRRSEIIKDYYADLEKFSGPFEGLKDADRKALAEERREKKIEAYTNDVKRLVDAYTDAGNKLSDKQINTLMYLFDFNEGDEDEYDSQIARRRYVEAGLPDVNAATQPAKVNQETGEAEDQNYFQRSLVYQNAVQGRYGIPREAAKTVDAALAGFKNTYKEYKKRVSDLNDKAYAAAKGSNERKKYQEEVEKVQEEYLNQLYAALNPVIQKYGTEVLSSNEVIESLQPFMSSMVPYSSIKKYGLQFNSGNDIVWGQLSDWIKNRWGASSPTAGSDPEVTAVIARAKSLIDQGKKQQAVSEIDLVLDRIARGTLSARHDDIVELRRLRGI